MNTQFGGIDFDLLKYDIDLYGFKTNRFFYLESRQIYQKNPTDTGISKQNQEDTLIRTQADIKLLVVA